MRREKSFLRNVWWGRGILLGWDVRVVDDGLFLCICGVVVVGVSVFVFEEGSVRGPVWLAFCCEW